MGAIIAGAAIALVGGIMSDRSAKKASKQKSKDDAAAAQRASQWEAYREEQQRKWNLEDYQRVQNFKEDAIGSFAQFAPTDKLKEMPRPERTTVDTSGLAEFDPNDLTLKMGKKAAPTNPNDRIVGGPAGLGGGNGRALSQVR